jgi:hypothetical protein
VDLVSLLKNENGLRARTTLIKAIFAALCNHSGEFGRSKQQKDGAGEFWYR